VKIAIIRFSSFGDILCTGPAVRSLKARYPDAEITYITSNPFGELAACLPGVDHTFAVDKKGEGYTKSLNTLSETKWDMVADLQGSPRSKHLVSSLNPINQSVDTPPRLRRALLLYTRQKFGKFLSVPERMIASLSPFGVVDDGRSLQLDIPETIVDEAKKKYGESLENTVVFVTGAKHKTKMWSGEYWLELLKEIENKHRIVFIGSDGDVPDVVSDYCENSDRCLDLSGKTSILEAAAVILLSKAVVSGDTGPMHMAVALDKPLVTMFGPTVEEFGFFPFRAKKCVILQKKMWCRPCTPHGSSICWRGHHRCLKDIGPDEVVAALEKVVALEGAKV